MTKSWKIAYYISTVLLSGFMLLAAGFEFVRDANSIALFTQLGYPVYLLTILAVAKVLGVVGIWQNKVPFLREWAYAGFVFDLVGALTSHLAVGNGFAGYAPALINLVIVAVSYVSFRKTRAM